MFCVKIWQLSFWVKGRNTRYTHHSGPAEPLREWKRWMYLAKKPESRHSFSAKMYLSHAESQGCFLFLEICSGRYYLLVYLTWIPLPFKTSAFWPHSLHSMCFRPESPSIFFMPQPNTVADYCHINVKELPRSTTIAGLQPLITTVNSQFLVWSYRCSLLSRQLLHRSWIPNAIPALSLFYNWEKLIQN